MLFRTILRYGLLLGLAYCGYTTMMWLTHLDSTYLRVGQYFDIAVLVLPITFIVLALRAVSQQQLSVGQRVLVGVGVSLVATVIYQPYLALYHLVINPGWLQPVLDLKAEDLRAAGIAPAEIARQVAQQRASSNETRFFISALMMGVGVLGTIIPLVAWPVIQWRRKAVQR